MGRRRGSGRGAKRTRRHPSRRSAKWREIAAKYGLVGMDETKGLENALKLLEDEMEAQQSEQMLPGREVRPGQTRRGADFIEELPVSPADANRTAQGSGEEAEEEEGERGGGGGRFAHLFSDPMLQDPRIGARDPRAVRLLEEMRRLRVLPPDEFRQVTSEARRRWDELWLKLRNAHEEADRYLFGDSWGPKGGDGDGALGMRDEQGKGTIALEAYVEDDQFSVLKLSDWAPWKRDADRWRWRRFYAEAFASPTDPMQRDLMRLEHDVSEQEVRRENQRLMREWEGWRRRHVGHNTSGLRERDRRHAVDRLAREPFQFEAERLSSVGWLSHGDEESFWRLHGKEWQRRLLDRALALRTRLERLLARGRERQWPSKLLEGLELRLREITDALPAAVLREGAAAQSGIVKRAVTGSYPSALVKRSPGLALLKKQDVPVAGAGIGAPIPSFEADAKGSSEDISLTPSSSSDPETDLSMERKLTVITEGADAFDRLPIKLNGTYVKPTKSMIAKLKQEYKIRLDKELKAEVDKMVESGKQLEKLDRDEILEDDTLSEEGEMKKMYDDIKARFDLCKDDRLVSPRAKKARKMLEKKERAKSEKLGLIHKPTQFPRFADFMADFAAEKSREKQRRYLFDPTVSAPIRHVRMENEVNPSGL